MSSITVVNIKCGGCEKKITTALEKAGLSHVSIDIPTQTVSFEGDIQKAHETLSSLGYPEATSAEAQSLLKKGHSYLSCVIGRLM
jgi:copper chaperone CopZ